MANANYRAGRREEYACQRRWEEKGYLTVRSAGSHGPWDVCAVKSGRVVELIQVKVTKSEAVAKVLIKDFKAKPPFNPDAHFHQVLEVRVKGDKTIMSVTI